MRRCINRLNTALLGAVIAIILVVAAFRSGMPSDGASTPDALVARYRPDSAILLTRTGPPDLIGCIRFCWFSGSSPSAIVLYADGAASSGDRGSFGWELAGESGGTWHSVTSGGGGGYAPWVEPPLVSYANIKIPRSSISYRYGVRTDQVMTVGRASSPEVTWVEVEYDTAATDVGELVNGVFALFAHAKVTCELRFFDARGTLLQRIGPDDPMLAMLIERNAPGQCGSS